MAIAPARAAGSAKRINARHGTPRTTGDVVPAALENNDGKPEADRDDFGAARHERNNCRSTFVGGARNATSRPREVLSADGPERARVHAPGRARPNGQPRRPTRQG